MQSFSRLSLTSLFALLFVTSAHVFAAPINAPAAMVPAGLTPSDHFYVVFVTSTTSQATDNTPATYDALVNAAAAGSGDARTNGGALAGLWLALVATQDGTNRADAGTGAFADDTAAPIYRMDGVQIAPNRAALFNASVVPLLAAPQADEAGLLNVLQVWSGLHSNGTPFAGELLGQSPAQYGSNNQTGFGWVAFSNAVNTNTYSIYAVSPLLQVTPAPGAAVSPTPW